MVEKVGKFGEARIEAEQIAYEVAHRSPWITDDSRLGGVTICVYCGEDFEDHESDCLYVQAKELY